MAYNDLYNQQSKDKGIAKMTLINMEHFHSNMFVLARLYHHDEPLWCDEECTVEAYVSVVVEKRQGIQIA
jgi:hypothetical protein